jgi:hypothetical protein
VVSPDKKLIRPHLNNKLSVVVHICDPSCKGGIGRRIKVQAGPGQKFETLSKKYLKKLFQEWGEAE